MKGACTMKIRITSLSIVLIAGLILSESLDVNSATGKRDRGRRGRQARIDNAPKFGDVAPLFTLESQDGKSKTSLADFKGKKPVVLFFGSYT